MGLMSHFRDVRAQCESKMPGKGVPASSLAVELWSGGDPQQLGSSPRWPVPSWGAVMCFPSPCRLVDALHRRACHTKAKRLSPWGSRPSLGHRSSAGSLERCRIPNAISQAALPHLLSLPLAWPSPEWATDIYTCTLATKTSLDWKTRVSRGGGVLWGLPGGAAEDHLPHGDFFKGCA